MQLPVHLERFVQVCPRSFFTGTKATLVVDCTVDGKNKKEDKTILTNLWVAGEMHLGSSRPFRSGTLLHPSLCWNDDNDDDDDDDGQHKEPMINTKII